MGKIFVISDIHFNHENIIKYCHRPFDNVEQMNKAIVTNWNRVVKPEDTVYFLGDWGTGNVQQWIQQLRGHIILIKGQHDEKSTHRHIILNINETRLLLVHDPSNVKFDGWVIHGHKHNNDITNYPFLNARNKTVNVSAEMTDYTPIDITDILQQIKSAKTVSNESRSFFSKQSSIRNITKLCRPVKEQRAKRKETVLSLVSTR